MDDEKIRIPIIKLDDTHILIGYKIFSLKISKNGIWSIDVGGGS